MIRNSKTGIYRGKTSKLENKLAADIVNGMTRCCICGCLTKNIHWHHTIPRSCGGEDSLQIPLDGNCHTTLHAKADAIVSKLHGRRRDPIGAYWPEIASEQRAEVWLRILVDALMFPPVEIGQKEILLPMIKVDVETRLQLDMLKRDLPGITNMSQVLRFCIEHTLRNRGLKNDNQNDRSTNQRSGKKRNQLW